MLKWHDGPTVPLTLVDLTAVELLLNGSIHRGELKEDGNMHWSDGDIWRREGKSPSPSRFGFQLYAEVQCARHNCSSPEKELGIVVGFTKSHIEVKFGHAIRRCLPADL